MRHGKVWMVDWVWKTAAGGPVAVFEIDGRDVDAKNCRKALVSLGSLDVPLRVLVQFQVDYALAEGRGKRPGAGSHGAP